MIGIFDSGVGGLTVMRAIRDVLPESDITYFGDIKNVPYGLKNREELFLLTARAFELLKTRGANRVVSACNSVSVSLALSLFDTLSLAPTDVIEMVGPTVAYLRTADARMALVATPATIESGIYHNAFRMIGKDIESIPIPDLAGAVESGAPHAHVENLIKTALAQSKKPYDILILACTHYPLAQTIFKRVLPPNVVVFDPSVAVAKRAEKLFWPQEAGNGTTHFIISQDSDVFRGFVKQLFPKSTYTIEVLP